MNRITRLKIENFRRLKSLDLEMRPLGVMVGANGSGKTSIFDALSLLKAAVEGKLNERMSELGGFTSNVTLDGSQTMTFGIEVSTDYYYELCIASKNGGTLVESETIRLRSEEGFNEKTFYPKDNNGVGIWEEDIFGFNKFIKAITDPFLITHDLPFRRLLNTFYYYCRLNVDRNAPVRLPQQIAPEFLPKQDGSNLLSVLYNLREQQPEAYDEIIETLKIAFPGFESLTLPNVAAGMMSLAWNDRNFRNALYQHQMSEGMLRMLWLTTILLNPHLTPLTMIDEPEVSLHPELLAILVGCFRKATTYTQLLAATHSTDLIRNLHPSEVLILDMDENGMTSARWGDDPELNLDDWLKDYTLGDVWQMGLLGGRAS